MTEPVWVTRRCYGCTQEIFLTDPQDCTLLCPDCTESALEAYVAHFDKSWDKTKVHSGRDYRKVIAYYSGHHAEYLQILNQERREQDEKIQQAGQAGTGTDPQQASPPEQPS